MSEPAPPGTLPAKPPLNVVISQNITAELARRGLTKVEMQKAIGLSHSKSQHRFGAAYAEEWKPSEVQSIAEFLAVDEIVLFTRPTR